LPKTKHGAARRDRCTSEYTTWVAMKERCLNPKNPRYPNYGARGITVCDRWKQSFEMFFADMGKRPSRRHSIDRRNNDGIYDPANCRWATPKQQRRNQRNFRQDLTGKRFGRLVVIKRIRYDKQGHTQIWKCICDCGHKCEARAGNLSTNHTQSCGCLNLEKIRDRNTNRTRKT